MRTLTEGHSFCPWSAVLIATAGWCHERWTRPWRLLGLSVSMGSLFSLVFLPALVECVVLRTDLSDDETLDVL